MKPQLYLITPAQFDLESFAETLARTLDAGEVACVQLRLKDTPLDEIEKAARHLMAIVQSRDIAFLINDHPELARDLGADGVHIGQSDTPYKKARETVGKNAIVGVTCHDSKHLAMVAGEQGADYVAFGAFYPSATKEAKTRAEPWILDWWSSTFEVPCVAIGGITPDNCAPLIENGADFLAVSSGVWDHPEGPEAALRAFHAHF